MVEQREQLRAPPNEAGVTFRFLRDEDAPALLDLLQAAFRRWPSVEITCAPIEHLRWKIRADVYKNHVVAELDGRIVGMGLVANRPARVRGRVFMHRSSVDLAVHPDFQRLGVLTSMRDVRDRAFGADDFRIGGFSRHAAIARYREGRTDRHPIGNRVQVLERPLTMRAGLSRLGWRGALGALRGTRMRRATSWSVREIEAFDERIDRLWEEAAPSFELILQRDADFLNWRYCDPRSGRHTAFVAEEDGRALGYAVVQLARGRGYLSDVLVLPGRLDVLESLMAHATARLKEAGAAMVIAWCPTLHEYQPVLRRQGYLVRETRTRKLAYVTLHAAMEDELLFLQDPETRVHLTAGDVDVI
jgi:hypothetical protein